MTFGAFALLWTRLELAFVWIGFVAVVTVCEINLLLEIGVEVACNAGDLLVFAEQRIFRFGVVEIETREKGLPAIGGVARVTRLLEFTLVRIKVTGVAGIKFHVAIARRTARRIGLVALFAGDLGVQPGKRVAGLRVVKILRAFPAFKIVAFGAFVPELAFVRILVARLAILRHAEVRLGEVFFLDEGLRCRCHVIRGVALFAWNRGMLAFELITGETVVELLFRRLPVDDVEIFAVVFEVAANTILAVRIFHLNLGMIAVLTGEGLGDFLVAVEAFKCGNASAKDVTGVALRGARKGGVGFRKRARRNLRGGDIGENQAKERQHQQQKRGPLERVQKRTKAVLDRRA